MKMHRLSAIVRKELIHIKRDRTSLGIAIMMPIVMLFLFGYALTTDVEHISTVVLDESKSQESRELIQAFQNSGYFDCQYQVNDRKSVQELIDEGKAKAGLVITGDYAKKLHRNETPQVQMLIDGADPTTARTVLSAAQLIGRVKGMEVAREFVARRGMAIDNLPGIDLRTRVLYNPNLESVRFFIPGLIGLVMQNITILLTAFALVRERERGTMEQLIVTPVTSAELILGKIIPYIVIGFVDFLFVLLVGMLWFHVPINGSIPLLFGLAGIFLVCALGMGMFFSTVAKNQLQAMQMALFFVLPSVLLSGFIFPREAMPQVIQWLGAVIPLTYFLEILRGIILKGVGLRHLMTDVISLSVFTCAVIALTTLRFRKRLD